MVKVGIFGNIYHSNKSELIKRTFRQLQLYNSEIYVESHFYDFLAEEYRFYPEVKRLINENADYRLDIALSLGGDGTFLRTATLLGRKHIPILGINIGRLGFLAEINPEDIEATFDEVFAEHRYRIEERSLLHIDADNDDLFGRENFALNEIAVLKRDTSSMITIQAYINDEYLNTYLADGLLIATPTGSTAYSMSVNGPIIIPQAGNFVLSPVAPHSLNVRPLVITEDSRISLKVETRNQNFLVALDGRSFVLPSGAQFDISKADFTIPVVKRLNHTFYETLRQKLLWGNDARKL